MQADLVKLLFTYGIAAFLVIAGMIMLFIARLDPPDSGSRDVLLVLAGFIGAAVTFIFNRETQTQTQRSAERAQAAGAASMSTARERPE